jgi:hypothetical protein
MEVRYLLISLPLQCYCLYFLITRQFVNTVLCRKLRNSHNLCLPINKMSSYHFTKCLPIILQNVTYTDLIVWRWYCAKVVGVALLPVKVILSELKKQQHQTLMKWKRITSSRYWIGGSNNVIMLLQRSQSSLNCPRTLHFYYTNCLQIHD